MFAYFWEVVIVCIVSWTLLAILLILRLVAQQFHTLVTLLVYFLKAACCILVLASFVHSASSTYQWYQASGIKESLLATGTSIVQEITEKLAQRKTEL